MLSKIVFFTAFLIVLPLMSSSVQAAVDPALAGKRAETKVAALGDQVIAAIQSASGDENALRTSFKKILDKNFNMPAIARFAMGRYWAIATADEKKRYTGLFKKMVIDVYSNRFSQYSGQKFEILGNKPAGRRDVLVNSQIVADSGKPVKIDWRLRDNKIIDVIVEGVSMSVTQRSEFASVIQNGGGQVAALITHLEK